MRVFEFKDGTKLEGELVAQALLVLIIKSNGVYYLVSKFSLVDDDKLSVKDNV